MLRRRRVAILTHSSLSSAKGIIRVEQRQTKLYLAAGRGTIVAAANVRMGGHIAPVERKLAGILAADVAGYSRLVGADEEGTLARLKLLRRELV